MSQAYGGDAPEEELEGEDTAFEDKAEGDGDEAGDEAGDQHKGKTKMMDCDCEDDDDDDQLDEDSDDSHHGYWKLGGDPELGDLIDFGVYGHKYFIASDGWDEEGDEMWIVTGKKSQRFNPNAQGNRIPSEYAVRTLEKGQNNGGMHESATRKRTKSTKRTLREDWETEDYSAGDSGLDEEPALGDLINFGSYGVRYFLSDHGRNSMDEVIWWTTNDESERYTPNGRGSTVRASFATEILERGDNPEVFESASRKRAKKTLKEEFVGMASFPTTFISSFEHQHGAPKIDENDPKADLKAIRRKAGIKEWWKI